MEEGKKFIGHLLILSKKAHRIPLFSVPNKPTLLDVGRNKKCKVLIKRDDVAEQHIAFVLSQTGQVVLENRVLAESNQNFADIFVNGVKVEESQVLHSGDRINLSTITFIFIEPKHSSLDEILMKQHSTSTLFPKNNSPEKDSINNNLNELLSSQSLELSHSSQSSQSSQSPESPLIQKNQQLFPEFDLDNSEDFEEINASNPTKSKRIEKKGINEESILPLPQMKLSSIKETTSPKENPPTMGSSSPQTESTPINISPSSEDPVRINVSPYTRKVLSSERPLIVLHSKENLNNGQNLSNKKEEEMDFNYISEESTGSLTDTEPQEFFEIQKKNIKQGKTKKKRKASPTKSSTLSKKQKINSKKTSKPKIIDEEEESEKDEKTFEEEIEKYFPSNEDFNQTNHFVNFWEFKLEKQLKIIFGILEVFSRALSIDELKYILRKRGIEATTRQLSLILHREYFNSTKQKGKNRYFVSSHVFFNFSSSDDEL